MVALLKKLKLMALGWYLVQEGGNIQTTEKSDFFKKSDFLDF